MEQLERRRKQEHEGGSQGPAVRGRGRGDEGARVEIWIRPSGQSAILSQRGGSQSSRDSEQDGELGSLSATEVRHAYEHTDVCSHMYIFLLFAVVMHLLLNEADSSILIMLLFSSFSTAK